MSIALALTMSGCDNPFSDSPTNFVIATPVEMAGDGAAVIFKAPAESYTCPLLGGSVVLLSAPGDSGKGGTPDMTFQYRLTDRKNRNDVVSISTKFTNLYVYGNGTYALARRNGRSDFHELKALTARGDSLAGEGGARLSIRRLRAGHYAVRASGDGDIALLRATLMPSGGAVLLRDATFASSLTSYMGTSLHDCGNWNDAADASAALRRILAHVPA